MREVGGASGLEFLLDTGDDENDGSEAGKWDDVYVSPADQFPDSPVQLGADVRPRLERLRELRGELERLKKELSEAQEQQSRTEAQIEEAERELVDSQQVSGEQRSGKQ